MEHAAAESTPCSDFDDVNELIPGERDVLCAEARQILKAPQEKRRTPLKCFATAAALSVVAFVTWLARRDGDGLAEGASGEASELWYGGTSTRSYQVWSLQTGCSNWQQIGLGAVIQSSSIEDCGKACIANAECVQFNFQSKPNNQCMGGQGPGQNSCTLWKGQCAQESNACFDLYNIAYTKNKGWGSALTGQTWFPQALNAGCSNWQQVQIGHVVVATVDDCGSACEQTSGCVLFNFQTDPQSACQGGGGPQGSCALMKQGCHESYNNCMDLYFMIDKMSTAYPQAIINSEALNQMNDGLKDAMTDMNKEMPEKINAEIAKKGYVINEDGMYVKSMTGMDSAQITMLQASWVKASALKGELTAQMQMVGKVLQPLHIPKATAKDSGMTIEFTATMYGAWMEALYMDAVLVQGPPLALTKCTVNQVYAGYGGASGKCLGSDFLGMCSDALNNEMTKQKGTMEQNMANSYHDSMQKTFDENVPMYPEVDDLSGDCYIPSQKCNAAVMWAKNTGIHTNPGWYPGLTASSTLGDFQNFLYKNKQDDSGCVPYCDSGTEREKAAQDQTQQFDRRLNDLNTEDLSKVMELFFSRINMTEVHHKVLSKALNMNGVVAEVAKQKAQQGQIVN